MLKPGERFIHDTNSDWPPMTGTVIGPHNLTRGTWYVSLDGRRYGDNYPSTLFDMSIPGPGTHIRWL